MKTKRSRKPEPRMPWPEPSNALELEELDTLDFFNAMAYDTLKILDAEKHRSRPKGTGYNNGSTLGRATGLIRSALYNVSRNGN